MAQQNHYQQPNQVPKEMDTYNQFQMERIASDPMPSGMAQPNQQRHSDPMAEMFGGQANAHGQQEPMFGQQS